MGCIRKTKTGLYQIDFRDQKGVRHRESFTRRKAADKRLREATGEVEEGSFVAPKKLPTFRALAEQWYAGKRDHRVSSQAQWRSHFDLHVFPAIGDLRIDMIDVARMRKLRDELRDKGLAPKTVNKALTTVAAVFKLAMKDRLVKWNPAAEVERLQVGSAEITAENGDRADMAVTDNDVLSPDEIKRLLDHATPGIARTLLFTAAARGARHDELLALSWDDVDFTGNRITIRRSLSWARVRGSTEPTRPRFYLPKTKAGTRAIPAAPRATLRAEGLEARLSAERAQPHVPLGVGQARPAKEREPENPATGPPLRQASAREHAQPPAQLRFGANRERRIDRRGAVPYGSRESLNDTPRVYAFLQQAPRERGCLEPHEILLRSLVDTFWTLWVR